jgi:hypothetical protein
LKFLEGGEDSQLVRCKSVTGNWGGKGGRREREREQGKECLCESERATNLGAAISPRKTKKLHFDNSRGGSKVIVTETVFRFVFCFQRGGAGERIYG